MATIKAWLGILLKDKAGRIVIWQWPNLPLYGWMVFGLASYLLDGWLQTGSAVLSRTSLFIWAYLELTKGASYFRRALGFFVFAVLVYNTFS